MIIEPTVGRMVWFWPNGKSDINAKIQPYAAQIAYVHSVGMINIGYLDANGEHKNQTSVPLIQEGQDQPYFSFCEWMPFQKGQAAKTEALEQGK